MMIYVIAATGTEFAKIGIARNPISRMRQLQTSQPTKLVLRATADWPDRDERRIHRCLASTRALGEWFTIDYRLNRLIECMQRGDPDAKIWLGMLSAPHRLSKILNMAR